MLRRLRQSPGRQRGVVKSCLRSVARTVTALAAPPNGGHAHVVRRRLHSRVHSRVRRWQKMDGVQRRGGNSLATMVRSAFRRRSLLGGAARDTLRACVDHCVGRCRCRWRSSPPRSWCCSRPAARRTPLVQRSRKSTPRAAMSHLRRRRDLREDRRLVMADLRDLRDRRDSRRPRTDTDRS
jgi:hypothetical protein